MTHYSHLGFKFLINKIFIIRQIISRDLIMQVVWIAHHRPSLTHALFYPLKLWPECV